MSPIGNKKTSKHHKTLFTTWRVHCRTSTVTQQLEVPAGELACAILAERLPSLIDDGDRQISRCRHGEGLFEEDCGAVDRPGRWTLLKIYAPTPHGVASVRIWHDWQ
jgi:hypothetical protein